MRPVLILAALALTATPALARDPILGLPLDCTLGEDCFILQYTDADPGRGAADFTCGPMSYDGHKGTDFALPTFAAMEAGVPVQAAAPGIVRGVRDGMPDLGADDTPPAQLQGRECGNGVVLDHGGGWETQYCHLKEGSVAVQSGQRVTMGATLGDVGYSGRTQFPHVHIAVRQDGRVVDPFNTDEITECGLDDGPEDDLWSDSPVYRPGGLVTIGASAGLPDYDAIKAGTADEAITAASPALVGWGFAFGGRAGDVLEVTITRPDGTELVSSPQEIEGNKPLFFRAAGKRRPDGGWPVGEYALSVRLLRDGAEVDGRGTTISVTP
ncbi:M23 family metallopeptidase [Maritimibacter sp. UBA3975]|uniref:M23 family metallopeptidase n=1 Tax=Maritimibacter sp. UBA3975 TaxID=1946833 RepID=UPI000C0B9251|nr:M23 family metallopeptidase [Maritimibacter sp. UBA3975]MAM63031.1 peptidase M24 [Maritimibacter sp.]|tara:strand:- start:38387 stop:39364 length:978 start_codon:yes stop_codon:yes gene_type:complete